MNPNQNTGRGKHKQTTSKRQWKDNQTVTNRKRESNKRGKTTKQTNKKKQIREQHEETVKQKQQNNQNFGLFPNHVPPNDDRPGLASLVPSTSTAPSGATWKCLEGTGGTSCGGVWGGYLLLIFSDLFWLFFFFFFKQKILAVSRFFKPFFRNSYSSRFKKANKFFMFVFGHTFKHKGTKHTWINVVDWYLKMSNDLRKLAPKSEEVVLYVWYWKNTRHCFC